MAGAVFDGQAPCRNRCTERRLGHVPEAICGQVSFSSRCNEINGLEDWRWDAQMEILCSCSEVMMPDQLAPVGGSTLFAELLARRVGREMVNGQLERRYGIRRRQVAAPDSWRTRW
jgi:hypothetical protein